MTNLSPSADTGAGCRMKAGSKEEKAHTGQVRCPVENEEMPQAGDPEHCLKPRSLGVPLPNDVEEDGCPVTYPTLIRVTGIKPEEPVTETDDKLIQPHPDQLIKPTLDKILPIPDKYIKGTSDPLIKGTPDNLNRPMPNEAKTDSSGDSPLKMGVNVDVSERTEELSQRPSKPSIDKAAKELSNLLKTLSVKDEETQADKEDDSVESILKEIDCSLAELRLITSVDHKLKGRGFGDEDTTALHDMSWYQWGQALDLQPAAELANFFSRENGDMFGNQQNVDQLGGTRTSTAPSFGWDANTGLNSIRQAFPDGTTLSTVNNPGFQKYLQDTTGPPSSTYQYPTDSGFEQSTPTSYLGLLTSYEEPSSQLSDVLTSDGLVSSAKRTKYIYEDRPAMPTPVSSHPTSGTTQLPPLPSSFYTSTQPPNIYHSSVSVNNTASRSPLSITSYSPAYKLSPGYSPYHSPSSGYYEDTSSPGSVFSPCPFSALPDSPRSVNPTSPSDSSSGSLSPNNSPTDSGLSSALWSPYSQPHSVTSSYPFSPGASEISVKGSLCQSSVPQPQTCYTRQGSTVPPTQYAGQGSAVTPTHYKEQGSTVPPTQYAGQGSSATPTRYAGHCSPLTLTHNNGQGSPIVQPSADQVSSRSPTASTMPASTLTAPTMTAPTMTAPTSYPPNIDFSHLLFEYTDEDGDSILHTLILIYENLSACGRQKSASFLEYIAQNFLRHPFMKHKLNKQNNKLQTPLYQSVQRQLLPVVSLLMESGADPNIQGRCEKLPERIPRLEGPLHAAASLGDEGLPLVICLVKAESTDINLQNTLGETPLHIAAKEHGSIYTDREGQTRIKSCVRLVKLLMGFGADTQVKDFKSGKTPVMLAIETKDIILVKTILECCNPRDTHALLNDGTYDLNTCMHLALGLRGMGQAKHVELVRMLLKKGGEAENENNTNLKAKDMAPNVFKKASKISS